MSVTQQPEFLRSQMISAFEHIGQKAPDDQRRHIYAKLQEAIPPLIARTVMEGPDREIVYALVAMLTAMAFLESGDLNIAARDLKQEAHSHVNA